MIVFHWLLGLWFFEILVFAFAFSWDETRETNIAARRK